MSNILSGNTSITASIEEATSVCEQCRWVWVIGENQKFMGWIDRENLAAAASLREVLVPGDSDEIAVMSGATLREALSRMLGQGLKSIPVVDEKGRLIAIGHHLLPLHNCLLYSRFGFNGFSRIAFVVVLVPHVVITMAAIFNNIVLTFI